MNALNRGAGVPKTAYLYTDAQPELLNIAFAETVPTLIHLVNGMCYTRETREVSSSVLPVFVLLWNTAMVLRRRMRETCAPSPPSPPSRELQPLKKRQRRDESAIPVPPPPPPLVVECLACMETCDADVGLLDCEHTMCAECVSTLLEARATDAFSGKCGLPSEHVTACPHPRCSGKLHESSLLALVPPEVHAMILFLRRKETPAGVSLFCCLCGAAAACTFDPDVDGAVFTCGVCGVKTCAQCERAAHPGDACVKRDAGLPTPEDLLSQAKIQHCPKCVVPEVKRRNCNHVYCKMCKTDWCWACGETLDSSDVTMHYKEKPECVRYDTETETERMRVALMSKSTAETSEIVQCALKLLVSSSLQQTESDI